MRKRRIDPRAIDDPRHIRVLASPVRHELVDTLSALGGAASAAALAEHLGRHADGLYYHLDLLCRSGLVEATHDADGERIYQLVGGGGAPLRLAYRSERAHKAALFRYIKGLLRVAERDFAHGLGTTNVATSGPKRELWAARNKGWVGPAELEEVNTLLERLCTLTSQPRAPGREKLVSFAFVLSPTDKRAKRRSSALNVTPRSAPAGGAGRGREPRSSGR